MLPLGITTRLLHCCAVLLPQVTVDADEKTMLIATAPDAYDLRNTKQTGGLNVLTPVADQGDCNTCTAFAVGAAAGEAGRVHYRKLM